ncbi:MAG TPA: glycosyltransferase family 4 protein [Steroidobacteraceae bacterium]|nr:glycosyltransferase family 4 protein [Steroidobacteraceae bacterium]
MRIAQVAPLDESVPPRLYGGTERIVSYLTETLVQAGHEVTLFASGDSVTGAELISVWDHALRLDRRKAEPHAVHLALLEQVFKRADAYDVIHFHTEQVHLPLAVRCATPCLTTLHNRLDTPGLELLYAEYRAHPLVSISESQRRPLPLANWLATIHHGLPSELHTPTKTPGKYLAFLGRVCSEKGVRQAIEIARRTGVPLKIAAKVARKDRDYFATEVEPRIDGSLIEFIGEIGEHEKTSFLGEALALLFPISWPEPFGLVMIEAMACGTPTIALNRGSVPEIIDEGVTGFIAQNVDDAVGCVESVRHLDRTACRERFEQRFSAARMSREYLRAYESVRELQHGRRPS